MIESRRVILIGDTDHHSRISDGLSRGGARVVRSFAFPRPDNSSDDSTPLSNPHIRSVMDVCRTVHPDDVLILAGQGDLSLASHLAHRFSELPCNIHIVPLEDVRFLTRAQIVDLGSVKTLQTSKRPLSSVDLIVKRMFDVVVASAALILLSPLMIVVAIAIKLDSPGSVLFRQARHGYNNKIIRVFKFRSMTVAEKDEGPFSSATENDCRVTLVGRLLRRTSIDELPQLFNVLFGEMSIVGPRPHATNHNKMFVDQILPFARRHNVKPGITGWAQVNGYRGPADTVEKMRQRVEYDLYYIDNWSLFFDVKIILLTVFSRKVYQNAF